MEGHFIITQITNIFGFSKRNKISLRQPKNKLFAGVFYNRSNNESQFSRSVNMNLSAESFLKPVPKSSYRFGESVPISSHNK